MSKALMALAVAGIAISAVPAQAEKHYSGVVTCSKVKEGVCVEYKRLTRGAAARANFDVGHVFGPTYTYTDVSAIPAPVVSEYGIKSDGRYVYQNGYLYEVDPGNYTVTRVIYTQPE